MQTNRTYAIEPRPPALGGGYCLRLFEDGQEAGGGVFPPNEATEAADKAAYTAALAEGEDWGWSCDGPAPNQSRQPRKVRANAVAFMSCDCSMALLVGSVFCWIISIQFDDVPAWVALTCGIVFLGSLSTFVAVFSAWSISYLLRRTGAGERASGVAGKLRRR